MKNIWITGANGQLGQCMQEVVAMNPNPEYKFVFLDKNQLDISDENWVETFFFSNKVDCIVNCAAFTAVDLAESEVERAFQINADGVKFLAQVCQEQHSKLIHISTDYVFDGESNTPYLPQDKVNPINVYGKSKLEGERLAMQTNPKSIIIRTSWVYSEHGKNFYTTMLRLMAEREEISVVSDQIGKPTHAIDLANYILNIIYQQDEQYGVRHFSGKEQLSWYEFALKIAKENGFKTKIHPIPTTSYPTPAKRPKWSVLGE